LGEGVENSGGIEEAHPRPRGLALTGGGGFMPAQGGRAGDRAAVGWLGFVLVDVPNEIVR
jgi:hypothetical protein